MKYNDIEVNGLRFEGFCVAGVASTFKLKTYDLMFDMGVYDSKFLSINNIFLSHLHADHMSGLFQMVAIRDLMGNKTKLRIYCPEQNSDHLDELLTLFNKVSQCDKAFEVIPVKQNVEFEVKTSQTITVKTIDVVHGLPSVGYTILQSRSFPKEEYKDLSYRQILDVRKDGTITHEKKNVPLVTYIGDSTIQTLLNHPEVGQSKVLFIEVTYLEGNKERAQSRGHTDLHELTEVLEQVVSPDCHVVLKHFSAKYSCPTIIQKSKEALPYLGKRLHFFISNRE